MTVLPRAPTALGRRARVVLAARDRGHGARVLRAVDGVCRRLARARSGRRGSSAARLDRARTASTAGPSARPTRSPRSGLREDGTRRALTFAELSREVTRLAEALVGLGVEQGDRVALFLPMSPEAAIASHACAHIGAIQVPIFSGFAAPRSRSGCGERGEGRDHRARVLRRGRTMPMLEILEEARRDAPCAASTSVVAPWDELVARLPGRAARARGRLRAPYLLDVHVGHDRRAEGRRSTSRAASSSRSRARRATRPTSTRATSPASPPTSAGSWARGRWSGRARSARTVVFLEGAPDWPADRLWRRSSRSA